MGDGTLPIEGRLVMVRAAEDATTNHTTAVVAMTTNEPKTLPRLFVLDVAVQQHALNCGENAGLQKWSSELSKSQPGYLSQGGEEERAKTRNTSSSIRP